MLSRVLNIIKKYELNPQKMNRLRFELQREDKEYTQLIVSNVFKSIYKRLGIKTNMSDEKDIFAYLVLETNQPNTFNLS